MEVILTAKSNIAEIWLTKADQGDPDVMAALPSIIESLKAQKRYPVVFRSGTGSLYDNTMGLILHNREYAARRETG